MRTYRSLSGCLALLPPPARATVTPINPVSGHASDERATGKRAEETP
jgi:hypothetical protein